MYNASPALLPRDVISGGWLCAKVSARNVDCFRRYIGAPGAFSRAQRFDRDDRKGKKGKKKGKRKKNGLSVTSNKFASGDRFFYRRAENPAGSCCGAPHLRGTLQKLDHKLKFICFAGTRGNENAASVMPPPMRARARARARKRMIKSFARTGFARNCILSL